MNQLCVSCFCSQLPLPAHLKEQAIISAISPEKDVDGLHILNAGSLSQKGPEQVSIHFSLIHVDKIRCLKFQCMNFGCFDTFASTSICCTNQLESPGKSSFSFFVMIDPSKINYFSLFICHPDSIDFVHPAGLHRADPALRSHHRRQARRGDWPFEYRRQTGTVHLPAEPAKPKSMKWSERTNINSSANQSNC